MRASSHALVVTLLVVTSLGLIRPAAVASVRLGVTVAPRVAPEGTAVTVSGGSCSSSVDVVEATYLGYPPAVVTSRTVVPDSTGAWSTEFPMAHGATYVVATCDGVSSAPTVAAPSDVLAVPTLTYTEFTSTDIEITTSPLVDGSDFTIFDRSGNVLGSALAKYGTATVRLPRSLGLTSTIAVGLHQKQSDIDLPYVPFVSKLFLPVPSQPSIVVDPPVAAIGDPVTASGNCAGSPHLTVEGQPLGWYDTPPVYVDEFPVPDDSGNWIASFPMPAIPSNPVVRCTGVAGVSGTQISPSENLIPLIGEPDGSGMIVTISPLAEGSALRAYTANGVRVPMAILEVDPETRTRVRARVELPGVPVKIVFIGVEYLGENAGARQQARVQAWSLDVPLVGAITDGASTSNLEPARRLTQE